MYNFDYVHSRTRKMLSDILQKSHRFDNTLSCEVLENSTVLPGCNEPSYACGGVLNKDGMLVDESRWHEGIGGIYTFNRRSIAYNDAEAIYIGYLHYVWGHAITDNLKKIWYLQTDECQQLLNRRVKVVFITMENKPLPMYVEKLLSLAGVDMSNVLWINHPTHFKRIYIPQNSFISTSNGRICSKEFERTIKTIKENISNQFHDSSYPSYRSIYLTRTKLKDNGIRDFGEDAIEQVFRNKKYEIISPQEYSVEEQIYMLMHCHSLAVTEGSISHNVIFCKQDTDVVIIRKADYNNGYQPVINEISNVRVTYIDAHHTPQQAMPWSGPFYLYPSKKLLKWAGCPERFVPYWLRISYLRFCWLTYLKPRLKRVFFKLFN